MTIGELSRKSGVPASTIRYYERIGVLPAAPRVRGWRNYGGAAVDQLAVLALAQSCGFSLEEMRRLLHGFPRATPASRRWQQLAREKQAELDTHLARITHMKMVLDRVLACRCLTLAECGAKLARSLRNPRLRAEVRTLRAWKGPAHGQPA